MNNNTDIDMEKDLMPDKEMKDWILSKEWLRDYDFVHLNQNRLWYLPERVNNVDEPINWDGFDPPWEWPHKHIQQEFIDTVYVFFDFIPEINKYRFRFKAANRFIKDGRQQLFLGYIANLDELIMLFRFFGVAEKHLRK